jgi:hypothetical protein
VNRWYRSLVALALVGCGDDGGTPDAGWRHIDPTVGTYRGTCDGSGVISLDDKYFIDINDEDQVARIYERGIDSAPLQTIDLTTGLGLTATDKGDLEEITRIGDRIFVIGSHSRTSTGALERTRYRLAAFDLAGTPPNVTLTPVGSAGLLLDQMLDASHWDQPDTAVITALTNASKLSSPTEPTLVGEGEGTNIEGLTHDGAGHLMIGFRNPRPGGALVVSLMNPDGIVTGQPARFGSASVIDLGAGNGVRGMAWVGAAQQMFVIGGPVANANSFALYRWSGTTPPAVIQTLDASMGAPEAVVSFDATKDVQIVYDMSDAMVGTSACRSAAPAQQLFRDLIVRTE